MPLVLQMESQLLKFAIERETNRVVTAGVDATGVEQRLQRCNGSVHGSLRGRKMTQTICSWIQVRDGCAFTQSGEHHADRHCVRGRKPQSTRLIQAM